MAADEKQFELSQYLDGDLSDAQRSRVEAELASDADARKALEDFRRVDGWAKAAAPPVPGVDYSKLTQHILDRLGQRKPQRRVIRIAWWTGAWLAAAAAVLIAVLVGVRTPTSDTPPHRPGIELGRIAAVEGVTIEVAGLEEPLPERTHPSADGSIFIDMAGLETEAPPAEGGIVIAMSGSVESDILVNSGPSAGGWDPSMMDSPM